MRPARGARTSGAASLARSSYGRDSIRLVRVRVGDVRLYFEVFGQEYALAPHASELDRRPVVIALHGGPGVDGMKLRFLLRRLAELAQVVVPDQRGHGRSDRGAPQSWNLEQWAADVKGLADALEIERPIVLGESFGGFVAQQFASMFPDCPRGMILVSCGPRFARGEEIAAQIGGAPGAEAAAAVTSRATAGEEDRVEEEWTRVVEPHLRVRREPMLERVEALRVRTMDVSRHFEDEGFAMDLRPGLSSVRCPTLVILGERDPLVPAQLGREIVDSLPAGLGRLEVVGAASHGVITDRAGEAQRLIRCFLREVS